MINDELAKKLAQLYRNIHQNQKPLSAEEHKIIQDLIYGDDESQDSPKTNIRPLRPREENNGREDL